MKQIPATAAKARILNPFIKLSSIVRLSSIVAMVVYLPHAFTVTTQISLDLIPYARQSLGTLAPKALCERESGG
ncbi:MAG: hypothetical protein ABSF66_05455 [Terriglobales bacterium]|jgi:hypothetical protein